MYKHGRTLTYKKSIAIEFKIMIDGAGRSHMRLPYSKDLNEALMNSMFKGEIIKISVDGHTTQGIVSEIWISPV